MISRSALALVVLGLLATGSVTTYCAWHAGDGLGHATLLGLARHLADERAQREALLAPAFREPGQSILGSYLAKIRRDGIAKHVDMKQKLDAIAEDQAAIVALAETYQGTAETTGFTEAGARYARYAATWRDRWNSTTELYMAGGDLPAAEVPYPEEFAGLIAAEITARY